MKTEVIHLRISPEDKARLKELAAKENRTISNYIENVLEQAVKKKKN